MFGSDLCKEHNIICRHILSLWVYVQAGGIFHKISVDLSLLLRLCNSVKLQLAWKISSTADIRSIRTAWSEVISLYRLNSIHKHYRKSLRTLEQHFCNITTSLLTHARRFWGVKYSNWHSEFGSHIYFL